jgi:peptidyl-prolyl cis-trans isomerase SDCCAG10
MKKRAKRNYITKINFFFNCFFIIFRQMLKEEIKQLRKELISNAQSKKDEVEKKKQEIQKQEEQFDIVKKYKEDIDKYEHLKRKKLMDAKESKTLELLESFRERLFNAKNKVDENADKVESVEVVSKPTDEFDVILTHKLEIDEEIKQKVIDANIRDNDRYDIFDPRNVLNKRKRDEVKETSKDKYKQRKH